MENNKTHYVPFVEEFHIGFEYERAGIKDGEDHYYESMICGQEKANMFFPKDFPGMFSESIVRVKYLDQTDIEALGWQQGLHVNVWAEDDDIIDGFSINKSNIDTYALFHDKETSIVGIYLQRIYNEFTGNWSEHIMFSGIIKNKSELKRLMSQLAII